MDIISFCIDTFIVLAFIGCMIYFVIGIVKAIKLEADNTIRIVVLIEQDANISSDEVKNALAYSISATLENFKKGAD